MNQSKQTSSSDYTVKRKLFQNLDHLFIELKSNGFSKKGFRERFQRVNELLLDLIQKSPEKSFLLPAVLDFIDQVNREKVLDAFHLSLFEFWLNHFSGLDAEENYRVRGKIAGKYLPRQEYQNFFPIGMGKTLEGTHFVSAHFSPDVDTMVASFYGWLDAFAARVGNARHLWSLPGGAPDSPVTSLIQELLGPGLFSCVAFTEGILALKAIDLAMPMDQKHSSKDVVSWYCEMDELRAKMKDKECLAVGIPEGDGQLFPIGIIKAEQLKQPILGTVSFRDFCNLDEVKMAPYLAPVSVIDHHKMALKTSSPPFVLIADVQSCNVLVAEQAFKINSQYSVGYLTSEEIDSQIEQALTKPSLPILQRLLQKKAALKQEVDGYYVHPDRELIEYICFMHAILDDTDLLSKVSKRDLECVAELLNRMQSLLTGQECEVINFAGIPFDKNFEKTAAKRILKNEAMYAFYKTVYAIKEQELESSLKSDTGQGLQPLFVDTKEQNGCCRVGQTKLFSSNFTTYQSQAPKIMKFWVEKSEKVHEKKSEMDFFLHMISTIPSAEEVYGDHVSKDQHLDELWFWVPPTHKAYEHLSSFLASFQAKQKLGERAVLELLPAVEEDLEQIFRKNCPGITIKRMIANAAPALSMAVLKFSPGLLNSRKAMITPFLPKEG